MLRLQEGGAHVNDISALIITVESPERSLALTAVCTHSGRHGI